MTRKQQISFAATGYLVSLLYTYGISYSLIKVNNLEVTWITALLYTAVLLLIFSLIFYNKWTTIATVVVSLGYTYWAFRHGEALVWITDSLFPFVKDTWSFLRGAEELALEYHPFLAFIFIILPLLFSLISASRLRGCVSMLFVAAAVFITEWTLGHHNIFLPIALSTVAIVAVYVYSFSRRLYLRDMSDATEDYTEEDELFEEGQTVEADKRTIRIPSATALAAFSLPIALITAMFTILALPKSADNFRVRFIETVVDDVVDYIGQYTDFTRKQYSFSISTLGYPSTSELGGPASPTDDTVLVVEGISPSLLKGATKTYYSGRGWLNYSDIGSYRLNSPLWSAKRKDVFDLERPDPELLEDLGRSLYREVRFRIQNYYNQYSIFSPTRPADVYSSSKSFIPYFNDLGELYPKERIDIYSRYTVEARQIVPLTETTIDLLLELEASVEEEPLEKMQQLRNTYLQLPDSLPSNVMVLGYDIASSVNSESEIIKALAIKDYLSRNFTYTLMPPEVPEGRDFVDYFLQTRRGYCSYFATAMVVLARTIDIPARYCEGFLLTDAPHKDSVYTVTGKQAHAWAELYFEGIGWIPFDATPSRQAQIRPTQPSLTPPEPDIPLPESSPEVLPTVQVPEVEFEMPAWGLLLIVIASIALVNTLLIIAHRIFYSSRRLLSKYSKSEAVEIWWHAILALISDQDEMFERRPGETAAMLASRIGRLIDSKVCTFDQLVRIVMRSFYSGKEISDTEAQVVYRYFVSLENRMMKTNTPPVYAVKRILFPRIFGFEAFWQIGNKFSLPKSNSNVDTDI
jgi:transglutaminase-like putative cysteine protease